MSVLEGRSREEAKPSMLAQLRASPLAVVDVGTTKIACFIARPRPSRGFNLLGRGYQLAEGFERGEVVDAAAAANSLAAVLHEAEAQAGETLREVVLVTTAGRPRSRVVEVEEELQGAPLHDERLGRLLRAAARAACGEEEEVLHVVPVEVRVDGGRPLRNPRGIRGERVALAAAVVTARAAPLRALLQCLERCHLHAVEVVAAGYAAAIGAATEEEMERGCLVLDFGGGTTTLAHFADGRLACLDAVPYGGEHVTGDIVYGLSTSRSFAERLKTLQGSVIARGADEDARITVPQLGDASGAPSAEIPRAQLVRIVRARVEEILEFVQERIRAQGELFDRRPPRSIVLTGGGSTLDGLEELVEEMFGIPARRGRPGLVQSRDGIEDEPCCAAASGALALAVGDDDGLSWSELQEAGGLSGWLGRFARWFERNF